MFKRLTVLEMLIEERQKNAILQAQTRQNTATIEQTTANLEYVAMMTEVDVPIISNDINESNESNESEVYYNGEPNV